MSDEEGWIEIATTSDIPDGEGKAFPYQDRTVAVFYVDGSYWAIDDFCPHMGASLAEGYVEDGAVACPWHAWRFSIHDGCWLDNPKIKVDAYQVRLEGEIIKIRKAASED